MDDKAQEETSRDLGLEFRSRACRKHMRCMRVCAPERNLVNTNLRLVVRAAYVVTPHAVKLLFRHHCK